MLLFSKYPLMEQGPIQSLMKRKGNLENAINFLITPKKLNDVNYYSTYLSLKMLRVQIL